jgi:hypothetical protein
MGRPGRVRARGRLLDANDAAVVHDGDAVGEVHDARVVRDDDQRAVGASGHGAQRLHHAPAGLVVERGGGLVAHDEARVVHQRARDGHALLLAAGELRGQAVGLLGEPDARQQLAGAHDGLRARHALQHERDGHVLGGGERGQQVEGLEDEAHVPAAEGGQLRGGELLRVFAEDAALAVRAVEDAGHDRDQRRLAAARRPHEQQHLAAAHV